MAQTYYLSSDTCLRGGVGKVYSFESAKEHTKGYVYILDELLNVTDDVVKEYYYDEIITTILDTGIADRFIKSLCELIQSLAIDKLHIIGDIYDRGPRADIIMDELMKMHDVDIQWAIMTFRGWVRLQVILLLLQMLSVSPCDTITLTFSRTAMD